MQRLYAASCLLFALMAPVAHLHGSGGAKVKCLQEPSAPAVQGAEHNRCGAKTGTNKGNKARFGFPS